MARPDVLTGAGPEAEKDRSARASNGAAKALKAQRSVLPEIVVGIFDTGRNALGIM